jgi:hypothetical protein
MECRDLKDDMMDVLYGEAVPSTDERVREHLAACGVCREEFASFRDLRKQLSEWPLPPLSRLRSKSPAWPLRFLGAAALLLVALGGGLGLSGSEISYSGGEVRFRLGRGDSEFKRHLAEESQALERQREEIRSLRASLDAFGGKEDPALLKRVQDLIRESDLRNAQLLETRLDALSRRSEAERRYDLARMSAGLSYLDGKTGQDVARTAELVGYVLKASEKK